MGSRAAKSGLNSGGFARALLRSGVSQRTVAARLGRSKLVVAAWFAGELQPSAKDVFYLSRFVPGLECEGCPLSSEELEAEAAWAAKFPARALVHRGFIGEAEEDKVRALCNFFQVARPEIWERAFLSGSGRISRLDLRGVRKPEVVSAWFQSAWLRFGSAPTKLYRPEETPRILQAIRHLAYAGCKDLFKESLALCSDLGVNAVFWQSFPQDAAGAISFILDQKPFLVFSERYATEPQFLKMLFGALVCFKACPKKVLMQDLGAPFELPAEARDALLSEADECAIASFGDFSDKAVLAYSREFFTPPAVIERRLFELGLRAAGSKFAKKLKFG